MVPWYQASYNYAANLLHLALEADAGDAREKQRADTPALDRPFVLGEAREEATALLRTTVATLHFGRVTNIWRWWGVLPPGEEGRVLRSFLTESVEPTAAVLLAGVLFELEPPDMPVDVTAPSRVRLYERLSNPDSGLTSDELLAYAAGLAERRWDESQARFGFRWRRGTPYTARAHYSFACFFSRVAERVESAKDQSVALARSLRQLRLYFTREPDRVQRTAVASWAKNDPSLAKVRSDRRTERKVQRLIDENRPSASRPSLEEVAETAEAAT
jgi:hypothetical protein